MQCDHAWKGRHELTWARAEGHPREWAVTGQGKVQSSPTHNRKLHNGDRTTGLPQTRSPQSLRRRHPETLRKHPETVADARNVTENTEGIEWRASKQGRPELSTCGKQ